MMLSLVHFHNALIYSFSSIHFHLSLNYSFSVWLYISAVLGGCFINGSIPLFYELTIETTYPIAEGIPMAVITTSNHVACLLFLAALMIPGIGKKRRWLAFTRRMWGASLTEAQTETFVENEQFHNQTFCDWVVLFDLHNVNRRILQLNVWALHDVMAAKFSPLRKETATVFVGKFSSVCKRFVSVWKQGQWLRERRDFSK